MKNSSQRWTDGQLKLAFYLYCQIPFGKLHSKNPTIIKMASFLGRTPDALAMKLVNFASLDPAIRSTGRKGLGNASNSDRKIWDLFHNNWIGLAEECESLLQGNQTILSFDENQENNNFVGETHETIIKARIGQNFFRKSVLASYESICCMSGVSIQELLIASHIIPWSKAKGNRLNPSNGLCLSAIHDKAFDKGFLTVLPDYSIKLLSKFLPEKDFLLWHNNNIFIP
jgi:predicted restriction endonuclease